MTIYEVRIYIKHKLRPLCVAYFENKNLLDKWINDYVVYDSVSSVRLGNVIFTKGDVRYVEIREKHVR